MLSAPNPQDLELTLRQQESLREVIESISSELELRPLLTTIVQNACELMGAENGTIGLVDPERNVICTEAAYQMPPDELGASSRPGEGLFGQIYLTHSPLIVKRYDSIEKPQRPDLQDYAVIGVPIFWHEQLLGVFGLGCPPPREWTENDVQVLSLYAKHTAIAIVNARQFQEQQQRTARITAINQVGQLITSRLSSNELLQTTVDAIHAHLHFDNIAILLVAPDDPQMLVLCARSGIYTTAVVGEYRQSLNEGIIGAAARQGQAVLIRDIRTDPRYLAIPGAKNMRAELAVPISLERTLFGVLNIESERPLSNEDAQGIQVIADQLAIAMENARLFEQVQQALDESKLLYATSHRISAALNVEQVVQAYLEQVATRGHYTCNIALYEFNEAGERVGITIYGRWSAEKGLEVLHERVTYSQDELDSPLDAGQTIIINNVHTDPRTSEILRQMQAEAGRPALVFIPLQARGQRIGLVVLSYPQVHEWSTADLQLYQATAAQLATAIDSRRQQELVFTRGQQLAVLEERQRLARELHDSVTQLIFSITLIAQSIGPAWRRDPGEGERRIERMLELSRSALVEMRALLNELRPTETLPASEPTPLAPAFVRLRRQGLVAILREHAIQTARDGLEIQLETDGYEAQAYAQEEALYRIAQEALNNVTKHAHAEHVNIRLGMDDARVRLRVQDDGCGFMMGAYGTGGMGLQTMRERAEALGGQLELESSPKHGTTLQAILPRKDERV